MPELNSVDGKSAELVLVKNCEELVGHGDLDIENTMVDTHRPNQMTTYTTVRTNNRGIISNETDAISWGELSMMLTIFFEMFLRIYANLFS